MAWGREVVSWYHGERVAGEDLALLARWEKQDIEAALPELSGASFLEEEGVDA